MGRVLDFLWAVLAYMFHSTASAVITAVVATVFCLAFAQWLMSEPAPKEAKEAGAKEGRRHRRQ